MKGLLYEWPKQTYMFACEITKGALQHEASLFSTYEKYLNTILNFLIANAL